MKAVNSFSSAPMLNNGLNARIYSSTIFPPEANLNTLSNNANLQENNDEIVWIDFAA